MELAVSLRDISKRFGDVIALQPTTLDIRRGEFFSLLGPSGCGKTTLLRIIGGFETPSSGDLLIGGRSVLADPPHRRRTNMIFQHMALFPHLTVARNIAFGLEMKHWKRPAIRAKVAEALDLVRLPGYGDRRVGALSGGQRQRIAMARALVNDPEVLLLDEPLGALDLQLRQQMQHELSRLHRATGGTFIFVTHDQNEAMAMSDRIAVMTGGRILQVGTPREIYEHPKARAVAAFIGHSNFLAARVADAHSIIVGNTPIRCHIPDALRPGQPATLALRYENIVLQAPTPENTELVGTIALVTYMGPTTRFDIRIADDLTLIADLASHLARDFKPNERVHLHWDTDAATLLTE